MQPFTRAVDRVAGERLRIVPALTEDRLDIADSRAAHGELDVVPGRGRPVDRRDRLGLRIAFVGGGVVAAVAKINSADERDIELGTARMP